MTVAPVESTGIDALRTRIDELDQQLLEVWRERADVSSQIGRMRISSGGTRISLAREQQIIAKFQADLGPLGAKLALLVLEAGRGAL